jgi:hypothetical protein
MSHDLTRWIEDAEARRFFQATACDYRVVAATHHRDPVCGALAKVPALFHALSHAVGRARLH